MLIGHGLGSASSGTFSVRGFHVIGTAFHRSGDGRFLTAIAKAFRRPRGEEPKQPRSETLKRRRVEAFGWEAADNASPINGRCRLGAQRHTSYVLYGVRLRTPGMLLIWRGKCHLLSLAVERHTESVVCGVSRHTSRQTMVTRSMPNEGRTNIARTTPSRVTFFAESGS